MKFVKMSSIAAIFALSGCGSPVPSGMYLTMSVSTQDVAVVTSINGKADAFLSGDSGSMSGSRPINQLVSEGENEATFVLNAVDVGEGQTLEPGLLATLQISLKDEYVDTLDPGERTLFSRELTGEETSALAAGETVTITERFTVDKAALQAVKDGAA